MYVLCVCLGFSGGGEDFDLLDGGGDDTQGRILALAVCRSSCTYGGPTSVMSSAQKFAFELSGNDLGLTFVDVMHVAKVESNNKSTGRYRETFSVVLCWLFLNIQ